MPYTYTTFVNALANEMAVDPTNENFLAILPTLIDDSEQLIYRELDLIAANVLVTGTLTPSNRLFSIPQSQGHILVVDAINIINSGLVRHPVVPATREGVDFLYPSNIPFTSPSFPKIFARTDDTTILFGPPSDSAYSVELFGTIRPTPLSPTNASTFLTLYLSDLFFAGAMVSASAYMRNFGAMSDDPKMAASWKAEFSQRLQSAQGEELRKSYISTMSNPPVSQKDA